MTDYIGLIEGRMATTDARLGQALSWLQDVRPETPNLKGQGNDLQDVAITEETKAVRSSDEPVRSIRACPSRSSLHKKS